MRVEVTAVDYSSGGIAVGHGLNDQLETVIFAGDWRPMLQIAEALDDGEIVEVELEDWQILSVHKESDA